MKQQFYFAQKAFIVNDGQVLLVQKSEDDPFNPGKWEVPGGRMDFGEDVDDHLIREVREEVGIEVRPLSPFYTWQWQLQKTDGDGTQVKIQIVAVARLCSTFQTELDFSRRVEDDFLGKAAWVPVDTILEYDLIPNMLPVVERFLETYNQSTA